MIGPREAVYYEKICGPSTDHREILTINREFINSRELPVM